ncbi:hypothetical protein X564_13795 [Pseudoalteromonas agarivorans]|nr:hypothetical protein X564_13795 [Pseudoalteromonas agarivorans]
MAYYLGILNNLASSKFNTNAKSTAWQTFCSIIG